MSGRFLLMADDYGLTPGVSDGISALARAGRLSGFSVMVGFAADGASDLRADVSVGLHLNLTLGAPLGPMPGLLCNGNLPPVGRWITRAWRGALSGQAAQAALRAEIARQLDRFEAATGAPPDHIDGHHHVHALPGVRDALAAVIARYPRGSRPLLRLPGDRVGRILTRPQARGKALLLALLTAGARRCFVAAGAPVNDGFAGFSRFDRGTPYRAELRAAETAPGPRHLIMCHPGHADAALIGLDPVGGRRDDEMAALYADPDLPERLIHPARWRRRDGRIDWDAAFADVPRAGPGA